MNELAALLDAVARCRLDDTARLVFADWLDENHPAVIVRRGELPKGFNAHWHKNYMSYTLGVRHLTPGTKWTNPLVLDGLKASQRTLKADWFVRAGAAEIGGYPVLATEPTLDQEAARRVCRKLQWAAGGCPVSFNRCAVAGRVRIAIWFTVPRVPMDPVDVLDEVLCGGRAEPLAPEPE